MLAHPRFEKWGTVHGDGEPAEALASSGCLGAEPPAGSRGKAPGQGSGEVKPPLKLKAVSLNFQQTGKIYNIVSILHSAQ